MKSSRSVSCLENFKHSQKPETDIGCNGPSSKVCKNRMLRKIEKYYVLESWVTELEQYTHMNDLITLGNKLKEKYSVELDFYAV